MLERISVRLRVGQILMTPTGRGSFTITSIKNGNIGFRTKRRTALSVSIQSINQAIEEVRHVGGEVLIGAQKDPRKLKPGSLEDFLRRAGNNQMMASYVAPILVECCIAEYTTLPGKRGQAIRL